MYSRFLPSRLGRRGSVRLSSGFNGNFASLFPGAYQVIQNDLGLTYGGTMKATAGNTSTATMGLTGSLVTVPVPIWIVITGTGVTADIYYDGLGVTASMVGVSVVAAAPIALTGAGTGLSITPTVGTQIVGDSWKATSSAVADQSGNGKDYAQAAAGQQPVVTIGVNGKPGLLFDGVNDLLTSTCILPVPGTTPWCGFLIVRRPTAAAGNARMLTDIGDAVDLLLSAGTSIQLYNNGGFGPTATGLPTNTWGAVDFKFSNSAADYIQTGSGAVSSGAGAGNAASVNRSIAGAAAFANIELLMLGYAPASAFSSSAFRAAVAAFYGGTVAV